MLLDDVVVDGGEVVVGRGSVVAIGTVVETLEFVLACTVVVVIFDEPEF